MDALHLKTGTPTNSSTKINNEELDSLTYMQVSSAILRFASPVFNETFTAGEAGGKRIQVRVARSFALFYGLCMPGAFTAKKITLQTVDDLLAISDYYQVSFLKTACEDLIRNTKHILRTTLRNSKHGGAIMVYGHFFERRSVLAIL